MILEVCQEEGVSTQTVQIIANRLKRTTREVAIACYSGFITSCKGKA